MRVAVDGQTNAHADRAVHQLGVDVEPIIAAVDLKHRAGLGRCCKNGIQVEVGALPPQQTPPGQMADTVHVRIVQRVQHALGYGCSLLAQAHMQRRNHPIQGCQHIVGECKRAVGQHIDFRALQQLEVDTTARHIGIHGVDLSSLLLEPGRI